MSYDGRASRSLRSTSSQNKSSYWVDAGIDFSLNPRRSSSKWTGNKGSSKSEHASDLNQVSAKVKPIRSPSGKNESRKGNLKSTANRTRNNKKNRDMRIKVTKNISRSQKR